MLTLCGANCNECELLKIKKCIGCKNSNKCTFGKKCWIAKYIEIGGKDNFNLFKKNIIDEFNSLNIAGMPKIKELYPLQGSLINLEYLLPNNNKQKILCDNEIYIGNQVECEFNDNEFKKYFGLLANMNFLLVCEYEENYSNPEIIIYKKMNLY